MTSSEPHHHNRTRTQASLTPGGGMPRRLLWLLAVTAGISVANIYYMQPLVDMVRDDMELSVVDVNMLVMLAQTGYACGLFFIIPLGDMLRRKRIILTNFIIITASLLVTACSHCYHAMAAACFITGLCSVSPQIFIPIAAQYSTPETKGRNIGFVMSGLLSGILLSRVVSGIIGDHLGWQAMFLLAALLMAVSTMVAAALIPDIAPTFRGRYAELMGSLVTLVRHNGMLRLHSLRSGLAFGSFLAMWACMAFKLRGAPFHAGSDVVGMLGLCGMAGVMTTSCMGGYIKRVGVHRFHLIGCMLQLTAWVALGVMGDSYAGLIIGVVLIDIGLQCIQLSNQSSIFALCPGASNRVNTIFMTAYFIGGSMGTFLAGISWQHMQWNGVVLTGVMLTILSALLSRPPHRNSK